MPDTTQAKPNPLPALLVYGTPSGPAMTQASWFRAEDVEAVKAAAKELRFSVIELQTDADGISLPGAHEGVLKGSGRMIVGSVSAEVYRRIEEHARKGAGRPARRHRSRKSARSERGAASDDDEIRVQNKTRTLAPQGRARRNPSRATPAAPASASRTAAPRERPCGSARGCWPPTGTRSANSRASGSRPSSGSNPANTPSSGSTPRDIRRSRAGRRTSPFRIPSSASRASDAQKSVRANSMGRPAGRPSSFRACP